MTVGTALLSHLPTTSPSPRNWVPVAKRPRRDSAVGDTTPHTSTAAGSGKIPLGIGPRGWGCVENVPAGEGWPVPGGVSHPSQAALSKTPINGGNPPPAFAGTSEETGVIST